MAATCLSLKLFEIFKSVPMGSGGVILSDGITLLQILTWSTVTQKHTLLLFFLYTAGCKMYRVRTCLQIFTEYTID